MVQKSRFLLLLSLLLTTMLCLSHLILNDSVPLENFLYLFCSFTNVDPKGKGEFSRSSFVMLTLREMKNGPLLNYILSCMKNDSLAFGPLYNFCVDQGPNFLSHLVPYHSHFDSDLKDWVRLSLRAI